MLRFSTSQGRVNSNSAYFSDSWLYLGTDTLRILEQVANTEKLPLWGMGVISKSLIAKRLLSKLWLLIDDGVEVFIFVKDGPETGGYNACWPEALMILDTNSGVESDQMREG